MVSSMLVDIERGRGKAPGGSVALHPLAVCSRRSILTVSLSFTIGRREWASFPCGALFSACLQILRQWRFQAYGVEVCGTLVAPNDPIRPLTLPFLSASPLASTLTSISSNYTWVKLHRLARSLAVQYNNSVIYFGWVFHLRSPPPSPYHKYPRRIGFFSGSSLTRTTSRGPTFSRGAMPTTSPI